MSKRRVRQRSEPAFPYGKSLIASGVLIAVFMLVLGTLADPKSGQITASFWVWLALAVFPVSAAAVFYVEYRLRNKRGASRRRPSREGNVSAKC
jgi:hypothetical protein